MQSSLGHLIGRAVPSPAAVGSASVLVLPPELRPPNGISWQEGAAQTLPLMSADGQLGMPQGAAPSNAVWIGSGTGAADDPRAHPGVSAASAPSAEHKVQFGTDLSSPSLRPGFTTLCSPFACGSGRVGVPALPLAPCESTVQLDVTEVAAWPSPQLTVLLPGDELQGLPEGIAEIGANTDMLAIWPSPNFTIKHHTGE